jgi:hypothetical protein
VAMKVLIIGPAFFDYTKAIAVEINSREVYAFVFNELHSIISGETNSTSVILCSSIY